MKNENNSPKNVLGTKLQPCCLQIQTGFYRDGYCNTSHHDYGKHTVCAIMTDEFLNFTKKMGNDLITPNPLYHFSGLKSRDKWCLCILRWKQSLQSKVSIWSRHVKF